MAKRVDYSLLVHRAHNLLKGVAEAHEYYTIKMFHHCLNFSVPWYGKVYQNCQASANLPLMKQTRIKDAFSISKNIFTFIFSLYINMKATCLNRNSGSWRSLAEYSRISALKSIHFA
jgi:hypothetical protein